MQGSEETGLAAQKAALLACRKKIIKFPIELIDKEFGKSSEKKNCKNKIIIMEKAKRIENVSKLDFFPFNNIKLSSSFLSKKENLVFLITFMDNNFKYKSSQKFLWKWGIKVARSLRMHWASNAPRYLVRVRQD
ncbi:MAG: hypothetical protein REH83_07150 [Rickettsiella sp.]|nr:hypothetical protein [Rickettsiella sp.]